MNLDLSVQIYSGSHGQELYQKLKSAWENEQLLIICHQHFKDQIKIKSESLPKNIILGLFTSGTVSGKPRLIFYSKKNILASLSAIRKLFNTEQIKNIFCYPQPTHSFGLILGYLHSMIYDVPLVFSEGLYSHNSHELWAKTVNQGTLTLGAPAHFMDLLTWIKKNNFTPPKSYSAIIGGAQVTKKLWHQIQDQLNIDSPSIGYGASEASPGLMHLAPGIVPKHDGEIGQLLQGVTIEKIDSNGFIFSGDNVCVAILDDRGLQFNQKIQINDILFQTPDLNYIFLGRSDIMINRGGVKFSPEVIEAQLFTQFNLKTVCVPYYSERLGEDIAIITTNGAENDFQNVQNFLKSEFSINLLPNHIFTNEIPLNLNNKIDRKECVKIVLKKLNLKLPISVQYLKPFLPHRSTAIWIHRISQISFREGTAQVDLDVENNIFTNQEIRPSACIELVAQAYGYVTAAHEILVGGKSEIANKTLIAEIRNAEFYFTIENKKIISDAIKNKLVLTIQAKCTHDFGSIKVITGKVYLGDILLSELSLKAFVAA